MKCGMVDCSPHQKHNGKVRVCILGSTGSIGKSALQIIRTNPEKFEVIALVAGSNSEELAKQILEFKPKIAALDSERAYLKLKGILPTNDCPELTFGANSIAEIVTRSDIDLVLAAIVGFAGLRSVLSALKANKIVALANKESLVCGGALVNDLVQSGHGSIIPVDSEHSAIYQVLQAQEKNNLKRVILTASGGPFWQKPLSEFKDITIEQALNHPRWKMGPKVTIDSATMMNKALEVIEAHWLFGMSADEISVLVHPQSIVHSLIELIDGSQLAQLGVPDMKGPIAYALRYPERIFNVMESLNLAKAYKLEFYELDNQKFPAVGLANEAIKQGGIATAVLNISNEVAVQAFLAGKISFCDIVPFVEKALNLYGDGTYSCYEDLDNINKVIREKLLIK